MEYIENSRYAKLAKKFLTGKKRKNYCEIIALNDDNLVELRFLQEFNDDDIKALRELREKYGKDGFVVSIRSNTPCKVVPMYNSYSDYHFKDQDFTQGCNSLIIS